VLRVGARTVKRRNCGFPRLRDQPAGTRLCAHFVAFPRILNRDIPINELPWDRIEMICPSGSSRRIWAHRYIHCSPAFVNPVLEKPNSARPPKFFVLMLPFMRQNGPNKGKEANIGGLFNRCSPLSIQTRQDRRGCCFTNGQQAILLCAIKTLGRHASKRRD